MQCSLWLSRYFACTFSWNLSVTQWSPHRILVKALRQIALGHSISGFQGQAELPQRRLVCVRLPLSHHDGLGASAECPMETKLRFGTPPHALPFGCCSLPSSGVAVCRGDLGHDRCAVGDGGWDQQRSPLQRLHPSFGQVSWLVHLHITCEIR